jgi:mRNA interferase RelE/StbE
VVDGGFSFLGKEQTASVTACVGSKKLDVRAQAIDDLQVDPRPSGCKKLVGGNGFRVRTRDYRILYTVDDNLHLVRIYRIGHRREVYRRH